MLQTPKTKYGYVRRLLALPLVFFLAFAYMVNAKNKEIIETNKEIEMISRTMEISPSDTLKTPAEIDSLIKSQQEKIAKAQKKIQNENEKIDQLNAETSKKVEELKAIQEAKGTESKEFQQKAEEIAKLGKQIDKIASAPDFKGNMFYKLDGTNWEKLQDNKELHNLIEIYKPDSIFVNGKAMNIEDLRTKTWKLNEESRKLAEVAAKRSEIYRLKALEQFKTAKEHQELSRKEQKRLNELRKKQQELRKKQQKLDKERREILKDKTTAYGLAYAFRNPKYVGKNPEVKYYANTTYTPTFKIMSSSSDFKNDDYTKITINGKEATAEELKQIDPNNIESIHIIKNDKNGNDKNEISVKTK